MCGISGYISKSSLSDIIFLEKMIITLNHRGPDNRGAKIYCINDWHVGFGQSRLSIIDLSEAGHQPMEYKHFSIIFNGEIYNYLEVKEELENLGHIFISNSDTEVILHAFEEWQIESVHKFIGMFAFSILDQKEEKMYLFRDRVGVKPLYYYQKKDVFLFSSELKSFHQHPIFKKKIDKSSLKQYFNYGYISAPHSIFENCFKLEPGHLLIYDIKLSTPKIEEYWNVEKFYSKSKFDVSYKEAKEEVHNLFKSAFKYRMVSDVPVGVFLSGGYDSTAVTAILQHEQAEKLKTFTIGFKEGNNEAPFAKETANYLGTEHTEYYFTTKEAQEIIPELPYYFDEPFFDSSAIPTIMVSRMARKEVTVALSADGGDEVFFGYNSYVDLEKNLRSLNKIPNKLKRTATNLLSLGTKFIPKRKVDLIHKLESISNALDKNEFRQAQKLFHQTHMLPNIYNKELFTECINEYPSAFKSEKLTIKNELEMAMAIDYKMYLPDDILVKVDRATMSASLEGREPLLDHRIIEYVAQLPLEYKYDGKSTKKILKDIVHEYIPKEKMDRPKTGFSIPIYSWLRNDLSYLLEEYLSEQSLKKSGIFNVDFVLHKVELFKKNKLHYVTLIWKLLMFQMWYEKWMK